MVEFGGPLADLIWGRSQDWILHKDQAETGLCSDLETELQVYRLLGLDHN
jgi:hypothetical protein